MQKQTMFNLDVRETVIIEAIHQNYKQLLNNQMITHSGIYLEQSKHPEKTDSLIEKINDVRLLCTPYLNTVVKQPQHALSATLESETSGFWYYLERIKSLVPDGIKNLVADLNNSLNELNVFHSLSTELFSINLGHTLTEVLLDYFQNQFNGNPQEAQEQFKENLEKQTELSLLINKECEQISIELIKLFHFREMLLLGKMSRKPVEPDARNELINRANLQNETNKIINTAIEIYFIQELSSIFNKGFQFLYQVHDLEIQSELQSSLIKWINQLSESDEIRQNFTQEIQLKFMLLTRDFLLEQMNQLGFFARHPIVFASIAGLLVATAIIIIISLTLGATFLWGIAPLASVGFLLASIATYYLINQFEIVTYKRNKDNRNQIQNAVFMINNEYLRLKNEMKDSKNTSSELIQNTKDFKQINHPFLHTLDSKKVARGSVAGWLREYASRYRHSKAIEVDLGHEYKQLIFQSRIQTEKLVHAINNHNSKKLKHWIEGTRLYLKEEQHHGLIKEFELIQKIKEQVLTIVSAIYYIPPELLRFYSDSILAGGLAGNETDFAHIRRFAPSTVKTDSNPYHFLCETALNLYKRFESLYAISPIFRGDTEYRNMLAIPKGNYEYPVTPENIEAYLDNSYSFLLSLCCKIAPGLGLDPLQQPAMVRSEFILYRMLLLKQLATLSMTDNKDICTEVKLKIKNFVKDRFNLDTEVIFDDLANQRFLLNKEIQNSLTYKNSDQLVVTDVELDNILQAITLDVAYNSLNFRLIDVLDKKIDIFLHKKGKQPGQLFAYNNAEREINPQGTQQFAAMMSQYCVNTSAFIKHCAKTKTLIANNVLECYRFNVSLQVYKTQLRIIKNIKELSALKNNSATNEPIQLLLNTFKELHEFSSAHCFPLKADAPCTKLFNLVVTKSSVWHKDKLWVTCLDSTGSLVNFINNLPKQIRYPQKGHVADMHFFKPQMTPQSSLERLLPVSSTESDKRITAWSH